MPLNQLLEVYKRRWSIVPMVVSGLIVGFVLLNFEYSFLSGPDDLQDEAAEIVRAIDETSLPGPEAPAHPPSQPTNSDYSDFGTLIEVAKAINVSSQMNAELVRIVSAALEARAIEVALEAAKAINVSSQMNAELVRVVDAAMEVGDMEVGLEAADAVNVSSTRNEQLQKIFDEALAKQMFDLAMRAANEINVSSLRNEAFTDIIDAGTLLRKTSNQSVQLDQPSAGP